MRTPRTPTVIVNDIADHPAAQAWMDFGGAAPAERIEVIKPPNPERKSGVYLLGGVGRNGSDMIAKESVADEAEIERRVYTDVLPGLSVDGPGFIGSTRSRDESMSWLFLEAVDGPRFDPAEPRHLEVAAHWLARLHTETAAVPVSGDLPTREPVFYEHLLHEATAELIEVAAAPAVSPADREVLRRLCGRLEALIGAWTRLADLYSAMPVVLVHGDFVGKNVGLAPTAGPLELRAFDWAEAHRGPAAVDLWATDPVAYERALRAHGPSPAVRTVREWSHLGLLLRLILSVTWEVPRLHYELTVRSMRKMTIYDERLGAAMRTAAP